MEHQWSRDRKMEYEYVIVVTYDSCDPEIYGSFKSKAVAEKAEKRIRNGFTDYDWRHYQSLTTVRITEVK